MPPHPPLATGRLALALAGVCIAAWGGAVRAATDAPAAARLEPGPARAEASQPASMAAPAPAAVPLSVIPHPEQPGFAIPGDFSGLSFESNLLVASAGAPHYFSAESVPLVRLFRQLGIRNLRVGGNTSDRDARQLPTEKDLDRMMEFAEAADLSVIYCLRLHNGDAAADAAVAKYLMGRYGRRIAALSIGQEPSAYPVGPETRRQSERMGTAGEKYPYSAFRDDWARFEEAIVSAAPGVRLCGPGVHNNGEWARRFIGDFSRGRNVTLITEHLYPGGAGGRVTSPESGRDRMLGPEFARVYQRLYDSFAPDAAAAGLPWRLEEVNNFYNGGAANVSNTFASALWGLDFMHWWAAHGAAGLNFHSGDRVAAGSELQVSRYTPFYTGSGGFIVRPLGYAIKAFDLGGHGRVVRVEIPADPSGPNLGAYATLAPDGALTVTLINKEHGPAGRAARVSIARVMGAGTRAQVIRLTAPDSDVAAADGVTLGGAPILEDASWAGTWSDLPAAAASAAGALAVDVPSASAAIVRISSRSVQDD